MEWQPRVNRSLESLAKNPGGYRSVGFCEAGNCHNIALVEQSDTNSLLKYWRSDRDGETNIALEFPIRFPKVAPFPDGRLLIADLISPFREGQAPGKNAVVLNSDLEPVNSFHIGSSIEDIQIDQSSRIWVSFFDEGVFGNHGWGYGEKNRLGAGGLICLSVTGELLWEHNSPKSSELIDDCYALNVTGTQANFYFYSAFKLGQNSALGVSEYYDIPLSGCHAFALDGSRFVFSGEYRESPTNFTLLEFPEFRHSKVKPVVPKPHSFESARKAVSGRGKWLHVVTNDLWLGYHMDDLPTF